MKEPFKVGDRVKVFEVDDSGQDISVIGKVTSIDGDAIWVERKCSDITNTFDWPAHRNQCRRLIRRPAREWWICRCPSGKILEIKEGFSELPPPMLPPFSNQDFPTWIRVREVRGKK
jgi:hypothetical protein